MLAIRVERTRFLQSREGLLVVALHVGGHATNERLVTLWREHPGFGEDRRDRLWGCLAGRRGSAP